MFGDHWLWVILLLLVALVIFGPKRLPELGHSLGRAINEFRHATQNGLGEGQPGASPPAPDAPAARPPETPATDGAVGATHGGPDSGRLS